MGISLPKRAVHRSEYVFYMLSTLDVMREGADDVDRQLSWILERKNAKV